MYDIGIVDIPVAQRDIQLPMHEIPKVALLIETSRSFGRDLLSGIANYSQLHGPWNFFIKAGDFEQALPQMKQWGGTGIIARIVSRHMADAISEANVPTIALGLSDGHQVWNGAARRFSEVGSNPVEVVRTATEHLLERQFSHFAYVGLEDRTWSQRRADEYADHLRQFGYTPHVYPQPKKKSDQHWEKEQFILAEWISQLPKPVGLFACNDDRGREVLEACRIAELRVPEDVAVIGVDNDEVFCDLASPPLSSVALNAQTAGFRAAELLDQMMMGNVVEARKIEVETLGVVTRRSTDTVAVSDPDVATALRFIHNRKGINISVESVVDAVVISRRHLEKRFRDTVGHSILDEIQLARLNHAKRLLVETTHSISKIASLSGFGTPGYFIHFFRTRIGKTPGKYRLELSS